MTDCVFGIFVGGRGRRLGGVLKGALRTPSGATILERLVRVAAEVAPSSPIVLVGEAPLDRFFLERPLPRLADAPPGRGPLGGLSALLRHGAAQGRTAVALASDLPQVSPELLLRLLREAPEATLYAPRIDDIWQPLFARYTPAALLPAVDDALRLPRAGLLSVFDRATPTPMPIDEGERRALVDWDEPNDLPPELRGQLPRSND